MIYLWRILKEKVCLYNIRMLSRQIYTPKYSTIKNIFAGDGLSTVRTPEKHQMSGLNVREIFEDNLESKIIMRTKYCPTSPQNKIKNEIVTIETYERTESIPIIQYKTHLSNELFDPSIVNTPPSEFMNHLKNRLDIYYATSS